MKLICITIVFLSIISEANFLCFLGNVDIHSLSLFPANFLCFPLSRDIMRQSREAMTNMKLDIHARLMKSYKQVPQWWFLILLVGSIAVSLLMSFIWKEDVQLPWWGMLFAFGLAWIVTLPIGVIQATTNQVTPFSADSWDE